MLLKFTKILADPYLSWEKLRRFASKLFDHEISELLSLVVHDCSNVDCPHREDRGVENMMLPSKWISARQQIVRGSDVHSNVQPISDSAQVAHDAVHVHGYYPFPIMPASMPVLQRLHLSGNRNPHGLFQLGGLEASCPSISHLRMSGVERAVAFANELDSLLQQSSSLYGCIASGQQVLFPTTLPKKLGFLIVQTALVSVKSVRRARLTKDMMRVLETFDRGVRGDNGRPSFRCLDGRDADDGDESKRLKANWVDRLSGGEGCWAWNGIE